MAEMRSPISDFRILCSAGPDELPRLDGLWLSRNASFPFPYGAQIHAVPWEGESGKRDRARLQLCPKPFVDELAKRKPIREAIEEMDKINVAFAGLGLVKPEPKSEAELYASKLTMTGLLQPMVTPDQLDAEGAIADFSNSFFDAHGKGDDRKWRFFLTAGHYDSQRRGIEFFRRMVKEGKTVVLIAGHLKEDAIEIALQAQLFNVWITDNQTLHDTAQHLCD